MWITNIAVRNRTTMFVLAALLFIGGLICYRTLPLEAAPEVTLPYIHIVTNWRGASPTDVEKSITVKIEDKLKGLNGVKKVTSTSEDGVSTIWIEFMPGIDIDVALQKVKDKVDQAQPDLPSDLEDPPTVEEINFSEFPVIIFCLASDSPGQERRLSVFADQLKTRLEGVPGVLEAEITGDVGREIQIQIIPNRLILYGLSYAELMEAVTSEHVNVAGGALRLGEGGKLQLRTDAEVRNVDDLYNVVVRRYPDGSPVYLRDVAVVVDGLKDRESHARLNTRPTVSLSVKKRTGENIVRVVTEAKVVAAEFAATLPDGFGVTPINDASEDIKMLVDDLMNNIVTGLILVIAVVTVAMGFRNSLVVSLIIPLSMLSSFIILKMLGLTLNMVVLFSLSLATGMLVDTAIVVTENVYRFLSMGVPRLDAARAAAAEVAMPVIGSGLTTIVAFIPLLGWPGIMGDFMSYLPKTLIAVLSCNLVIALIITPAIAAVFVKAPKGDRPRTAEEVLRGGDSPLLTGGGPVIGAYRAILRLALRFRLATLAAASLAVLLTIGLWVYRVGLVNPMEFFVTIDPYVVKVRAILPQGADLAYSDRMAKEIASRIFDPRAGTPGEDAGLAPLLHYAEAGVPRERTKASTGAPYESRSAYPDVEYVFETSDKEASVTVTFTDFVDRTGESPEMGRVGTTKAIVGDITRRMEGIPGAEISVVEEGEGPPAQSPIMIELEGDDYARMGELAQELKVLIRRVPHTRGVRDDYEEGAPTLRVSVNRARAAVLGLSSGLVGNVIRVAMNGHRVTTYRAGEKDYDIVVRFRDDDRNAIQVLERLFLTSPTHGKVPLTTVAKLEYTGGMGTIKRSDFRRVVTVEAEVDSRFTTGDTARRELRELMRDNFRLPPGYAAVFKGEEEDQAETTDYLGQIALPVALLLVTLVLVAQFNSLLYPLIIMTEVLMSLGGAFLGLFLFNLPFSVVMAGIAIISLAGVVVNNGIILIDYTLALIRNGMPPMEAVVVAGATRLRPVFLTAITTVLGVMPIVVGVSLDINKLEVSTVSETAQFWKTMAVVTVFGLTVATAITLVVVPVLFSLLHGMKQAVGGRATRIPHWCVWRLTALWWEFFDLRAGTHFAAKWHRKLASLRVRGEIEVWEVQGKLLEDA